MSSNIEVPQLNLGFNGWMQVGGVIRLGTLREDLVRGTRDPRTWLNHDVTTEESS